MKHIKKFIERFSDEELNGNEIKLLDMLNDIGDDEDLLDKCLIENYRLVFDVEEGDILLSNGNWNNGKLHVIGDKSMMYVYKKEGKDITLGDINIVFSANIIASNGIIGKSPNPISYSISSDYTKIGNIKDYPGTKYLKKLVNEYNNRAN